MESTGRVSYAEQRTISTFDLAMELGMHPGSLSRWVKEWASRDGAHVTTGKRGAYRMPITYRLVGRGWQMTQDAQVRDVMMKVLPSDPKEWLIVVGNVGITCYTSDEARNKVSELIGTEDREPISIFHVGRFDQTAR